MAIKLRWRHKKENGKIHFFITSFEPTNTSNAYIYSREIQIYNSFQANHQTNYGQPKKDMGFQSMFEPTNTSQITHIHTTIGLYKSAKISAATDAKVYSKQINKHVMGRRQKMRVTEQFATSGTYIYSIRTNKIIKEGILQQWMANFWHPRAPLPLPDSSELPWINHNSRERFRAFNKRERERDRKKKKQVRE